MPHGRSSILSDARQKRVALIARAGHPSGDRTSPKEHLRMEALEQRVLLAVVEWDGGPSGLGTDFHDAANWVGDALPGPADDAVISVGANSTITITSSITLNSITSDEAIALNSGTLTLNGASEFNAHLSLLGGVLSGTGDVSIATTADWTAASLSGSGALTIAPGATLSINTTQHATSRPIDNFGTVHWSGSNLRLNGSGAVFTNKPAAVLNISTASVFSLLADSGNPQLINEGTINKSGSDVIHFTNNGGSLTFTQSGTINVDGGTMSVNAGVVGNFSGLVDVDSGSTVNFNGSFTYTTGFDTAGLGTKNFQSGATHTFNNVTLTDGAGGVNFVNGAIAGTGNLTIGAGAVARVYTASMAGSGSTIVATGGTLVFLDSERVINRPLDNFGTISWTGSNIRLYTGAVITNKSVGVVNVVTDSVFSLIAESGTPQFINEGTINKSGADVLALYSNSGTLTFTHTGALNVDAGTLSFGANVNASFSAPIDVDSGSTLDIFGSFTYTSGFDLAGLGAKNFQSGTHTFNDVTLTGSAGINFVNGTIAGTGNLTIAGAATLNSAALAGSGTLIIAPGASLFMSTTEHASFRPIDNFGTIHWSGSNLRLNGSGAVFTNKVGGTFNIDTASTYSLMADSGTPQFINQGTLNKLGSASINFSNNGGTLTFSNTGLVVVSNGTLQLNVTPLQASGSTLAGGSWHVANL